jgi:hypothetical protein
VTLNPVGAVGAEAHDRNALSTFKRPLVPTHPANAGITSTLLMRVVFNATVSSAHFDRISAAAPDTCGVAIEVPLKY